MENVKFSIKIQFFKNSLIFIWDISVDLICNGSASPPPHLPTFFILSLNIIVTYLANDRINKKHKTHPNFWTNFQARVRWPPSQPLWFLELQLNNCWGERSAWSSPFDTSISRSDATCAEKPFYILWVKNKGCSFHKMGVSQQMSHLLVWRPLASYNLKRRKVFTLLDGSSRYYIIFIDRLAKIVWWLYSLYIKEMSGCTLYLSISLRNGCLFHSTGKGLERCILRPSIRFP